MINLPAPTLGLLGVTLEHVICWCPGAYGIDLKGVSKEALGHHQGPPFTGIVYISYIMDGYSWCLESVMPLVSF